MAPSRSTRSPTSASTFAAASSPRSSAAQARGNPRCSRSSRASKQPDQGETDPAANPQLPWSKLAFLPQRFGLLPELTIRENIEYPARLTGTLAEHGPAVEPLLDRLGLSELANRPPHETSIGQQQRTALARALVLQPDVLLADEPTSHQDAGWRDAVWELLVDAAETGTACLIATHEEQIAHYANRTWAIDDGAIALSGAATAPRDDTTPPTTSG